MPDHRDDRLTAPDEEIDACTPIAPAPFQTTRTCNKLPRYTGIPVRCRP